MPMPVVATATCAVVGAGAPLTLLIRKGAKARARGCAVEILLVVDEHQIWVRSLGSDETWWVTADELSSYLPDPVEEVRASPVEAQEDDAEDLERAMEWVRKFETYVDAEGYLSPDNKRAICNEMGVDRRTVERHLALYAIDPSPTFQRRGKSGPDTGSSNLSRAAEAIVQKTIDDCYETSERQSIKAVANEARRRCNAAGLKKLPHYSTVYRRIEERDRLAAARRRHGRVRGNAKLGPAGPLTKIAKALEFVQMDHAIVDLMIVDPETREEIGRPWITLAIDVATRVVLGFYLTLDDPSQTSVALALENACCPKDAWLKELGIEGKWVPMGIMQVIGWDNAKCFRASGLVAACMASNIMPRFRKVKNPVHGAHIERLIGTIMGMVHLLKGTTFSNTKEREDYNPQAKAFISLNELTAWLVHQINGVYHNTPHKGLGNRTPLQAWNEALSVSGKYALPPIPGDRRAFRLSLLPSEKRRVTREGINRFALKYWDGALVPFIGNRKKYRVAHDPRDISRVYLWDGTSWFDIPWRDQTRVPIALWEWERAKRIVAAALKRAGTEAEVFAALTHCRAIEDQAERTTRSARRDRARRPKDERPRTKQPALDYSKPSSLEVDARLDVS